MFTTGCWQGEVIKTAWGGGVAELSTACTITIRRGAMLQCCNISISICGEMGLCDYTPCPSPPCDSKPKNKKERRKHPDLVEAP